MEAHTRASTLPNPRTHARTHRSNTQSRTHRAALGEPQEEFSERPVEQRAIGADEDDDDEEGRKEAEEKRLYEEANYTRLVENKADKKKRLARERSKQNQQVPLALSRTPS